MRALLCQCRYPLSAENNEALLGMVWGHTALALTDVQVMEIVSTRAYDSEYVPVSYVDGMGYDEEFGPEPH